MNVKNITYLISGLFLSLLLSSCNNDDSQTTDITQINDAQIYSFSIKAVPYKDQDSTLRALDSIRFIQVNKTKFAIDQVSGIIYNPDSFPYGTVFRNKVEVSATYNPNYGVSKVEITSPDFVNGYTWNNTDSIDFSKMPVTFAVTALSGGTPKPYDIDFRIHQINPNLMLWSQMQSYPTLIGDSKTLLVDNDFYTYSVQAGNVNLFRSNKNSLNWQLKSVSGLPATVKIESIYNVNDVFYAILDNGESYKSDSSGENWAQTNNNYNLASIVGVLPAINSSDEELLVIINDNSEYYFGKTKDLSTINVVSYISISPTDNRVPSGFPFQKQASFRNTTTDKNNRMLILDGGLDLNQQEISSTWFIRNSNNGLDITLSASNNYFKGSGLSNTIYDSKLYVLSKNQFYISDQWGISWYKAPAEQALNSAIPVRLGQTLIVDDENYIWIFGGMSENGTYLNDVWRGRLNKLI